MKLGYILLVHEPFEQLRPLLDALTKYDDVITLHYDLATEHHDDITQIKQHYPSILLARREKVEWGEASIVKATLNGMEAIVNSDLKPDYITLLSGSCFPIQSRAELLGFLKDNKGNEFIECADISQGTWVMNGLEWARWEYFHYFNWRKNPRLFSLSEKLQKKVNIKRKFPYGDKMFMGSQWWTLSYEMIEQIIATTNQHKLYPFIKRTWIPDEFYFQTLVGNLINDFSSIKKPLMNYKFNHTGIPKIYTYFDEVELQRKATQSKFFTRKIKYNDNKLLAKLSDVYKNKTTLLSNNENNLKQSLSLHWFKKYGFNNWLADYPLPIVIVLSSQWHGYKMRDYKNKLSGMNSNFKVFGDLFAHHKIDFNGEEDIATYTSKDSTLRDYSIEEFFASIAIASKAGFSCYFGSTHLSRFLDQLKKCANVTFVHVIDSKKMSLNEINECQRLARYLSGYECHYERIEHWNDQAFVDVVQKAQQSNLYHQRVS